MARLQRKEADAMAVDGGQVYSAGKCGLVVAMVEEYNNECEQKSCWSDVYINHVCKIIILLPEMLPNYKKILIKHLSCFRS